jgi:hypothetical protein
VKRITLACALALIALAPSLQAQNRLGGSISDFFKEPDGPVPRLPDGKPDFSGVWLGGIGNIDRENPGARNPDWVKNKLDPSLPEQDPQIHCQPLLGRPTPYPWRIVFTPTHAFLAYEMYNYRQIFIDGRKHPPADELFPTWWGHSIGWWEGDTFVVDTVGINDKGWWDTRGPTHSDKAHMIERYTRTNLGKMDLEITLEDPAAFIRPVKIHGTARLMPDAELIEYICNENNQDIPYNTGITRDGKPAAK